MKNINAIFDDKTYNEDLKNTIWKFFSAVVDAKKEERLKIISNLRKLAIMIGYDEKAIECIDNFLGEYLEYLKNINGIKKVEICDDHVKICLSNGKNIIFSSLSQYLGNYSRTITEKDIEELESHQGLFDCHKGSIFTSM